MSALFNKAKQSFLSQSPSIDMDTDTIKCSIGRTSVYTFAATDQYKNAVTTVQDGSAAMSGVTVTDGAFDANDVTFTAVAAGAALDFLVIWKDTGTPSTSPLVAYIDGFSVTPNGGDITAQWDNGSNRIFHL